MTSKTTTKPEDATAVADALLRQDFASFVEWAWPIATGSQANYDAPYFRYMMGIGQAIADGDEPRLALNVPPRHGKSLMFSVMLPVFLLLRDPAAKVLCVTHDEKLAEEHHQMARRIVGDPRIAKLGLSVIQETKEILRTSSGGFRKSFTMGGNITGHGGDFIIIDDPINAKNVTSATLLEGANDFLPYLTTRLDQPKVASILLVMQRLAIGDPTDRAREMGWPVISMSLSASVDENWRIRNFQHFRKRGDYLDPGRIDQTTAEAIRREQGSAIFEAQYQQNPLPSGGGYIDQNWFKTYDKPPPFDAVFQSWDIASMADKGDYSVGTTWGVTLGKFYLISVDRYRVTTPDLIRFITRGANKHRPRMIVIEENGAGKAVADFVRQNVDYPVRTVSASRSKGDRLAAVAPIIERGDVLIPSSAPWLKDFLNEVVAFPNGAYDDQVDSMSQFLGYAPKILKRSGLPSPEASKHVSIRHYGFSNTDAIDAALLPGNLDVL